MTLLLESWKFQGIYSQFLWLYMVPIRSSSELVAGCRSFGTDDPLAAAPHWGQCIASPRTWARMNHGWCRSLPPWMSQRCPKDVRRIAGCPLSSSGFSMDFSDHVPAMSDFCRSSSRSPVAWCCSAASPTFRRPGGGHQREWPYGFSILWMASYKLVNLWKIDALWRCFLFFLMDFPLLCL